jgi:NADH dehydrogenase
MRVAITGANGYLGSYLSKFLSQRGICTIPMVRSSGFELNGRCEIPPDIDVLIHSAHDFRTYHKESNFRSNVHGSLKLFSQARQQGIDKILFISSLAAFTGCQSTYGKCKLAVENQGSSCGVISIRPGTIYGGENKGVFGTLKKIAAFPFFILPADGQQRIYLVHIDDLCEKILNLINSKNLKSESPLLIAHPKSVAILEILCLLNSESKKSIKLPTGLLLASFRMLEMLLRGKSPVRSDSLISLLNPNPQITFESYCNDLRSFKN